MRRTATELLEPFLSGSRMTADELLWTMLVVGLILAIIHLVTMFVTRWGNRRITGKALLFSIVVHLSCIAGMVAVEPRIPGIPAGGGEEQRETVIQLGPSAADNEAEAGEATTGESEQTPAWDQITQPEPVPVSRMDRLSAKPAPSENTRAELPQLPQPEIDVAPPVSVAEVPAPQPKPEIPTAAPLPRLAASPLPFNAQTAEARPEAAVPSPTMAREQRPIAGPARNDNQRESKSGSVERIAPQLDLAGRTSTIDATTDPTAELQRGPDATVESRRAGPAPLSAPAPEPGLESTAEASATPGSGEAASLLGRALPTANPGGESTAVNRMRPDGPPATAGSSQQPLMVRDSGGLDLARIGPAPDVTRPEFDAVRSRKNSGVPSTYRLRNLARRKDIAREFGGTDESERAVEASLKWLSEHQHADGYWDADAHGAGKVKIDESGVDRNYAGRDADSGVTALAVLAFLAAGYTHEEGQYAEQVDRAIKWLIRQQRPDGNLGDGTGKFAMMYSHAMATYALAEAYGMQSDPTTDARLREPVAKGVNFIIGRQNLNDGGWRYEKATPGDMSIFGWQLMALKSAEIAGVRTPAEARARMVRFLRDRSLGDHQGLAGYRKDSPPSPSMTAEALFCKQMLGIKRSNAASVEAAEYLIARAPKRTEWNEYYWYYGTLAMYQYGGKEWQTWNEALRDRLIAEQRTSGDAAGSWDPKGPWGPYGGRVYSTALSTLCLEVYYRFLPLYQMGGQNGDQ